MIKTFQSLMAFGVTLLSCQPALATLNPDENRGEKIVKFHVPGRQRPEICVIPKHLPTNYEKRDLKREKNLCELDFYSTAAVCPKLNSTNPGLDIHTIPDGYTLKQVIDHQCLIKDPNADPDDKKPKDLAKKIAKYKLSTSCSYTPSILAYYHVSRFLGDILNVPVAVLRTVDLQNHIALGNLALQEAKPTDVIHTTWAALMKQLTLGENAPKKDLLLTDAADQSYGALVEVPKKDFFYKEFFNGGASNEIRTQNLAEKNAIIATLAKPGLSAGNAFTAANVQLMVQLRDAANMIIIDTLLNQEDRMGNVHYYRKYYALDSSQKTADGKPTLISFKEKDLEKAGIDPKSAVEVKEMLLKDNDCGVSRTNLMKKYDLAGKIAHIDPVIYQNLMRLSSLADRPETEKYFTTELAFTANDYAGFRKNVSDLSKQLHDACRAGKLSLDLDLQSYFAGSAAPMRSCD